MAILDLIIKFLPVILQIISAIAAIFGGASHARLDGAVGSPEYVAWVGTWGALSAAAFGGSKWAQVVKERRAAARIDWATIIAGLGNVKVLGFARLFIRLQQLAATDGEARRLWIELFNKPPQSALANEDELVRAVMERMGRT